MALYEINISMGLIGFLLYFNAELLLWLLLLLQLVPMSLPRAPSPQSTPPGKRVKPKSTMSTDIPSELFEELPDNDLQILERAIENMPDDDLLLILTMNAAWATIPGNGACFHCRFESSNGVVTVSGRSATSGSFYRSVVASWCPAAGQSPCQPSIGCCLSMEKRPGAQ